MKNTNFVREDIQGILSSHKISEKYNERDVFYIKSCISQHSQENTCVVSLFKKNLQTRCFPVNMTRVLRASIFQNFCERLFERFPIGTNNTVIAST